MLEWDRPREPQFVHDCDGCTFIGNGSSVLPNSKEVYDIYVCQGPAASGIDGCSIIARFGNKGHQYASAPVSVAAYMENPKSILARIFKRLVFDGVIDLSINSKGLERLARRYQ